MSETLQLPALQIHGPADGECNGCEVDSALSSSSSPSLRRKRFKMRRMKNVMSEKEQLVKEQLPRSGSKEYLQLPSIEITPSSDEDAAWSSCSTPSASPQRRRFLLRKWLRGGEKKEHGSESSSQQSSLQSSHEEESTRYLSPNARDDSVSAGGLTTTAAQPPCGSELSDIEGAGLCGSSWRLLGCRAKHSRTPASSGPVPQGLLEPEILVCASPLRPPETQQGQRNMCNR
ncbi:uncharacterized protein [Garra rufa]|uniref:uncharacterized protein n=1 Tax=Garra rufa TaxID=137080 RepID=UPI003CCE5DD8